MMTPLELAEHIQHDYEGRVPKGWALVNWLDWGKARASVIERQGFRLGLITGTNDLYDMLIHDALMAIPWPGETRWWGLGGMLYANKVYGFMKATGPDAMAAHSIGGTVLQIVGSSLRVPSTCFNPARALVSRRQPRGAEFVRNFITLDIINHLPPWHSHVGSVTRIPSKGHGIRHCIDGLRRAS